MRCVAPSLFCVTTTLLCAFGPRSAQAQSEIPATAAFAVPKDPSGQKVAARVDAVLKTRVAGEPRFRRLEPARILSGDPRTREEETLERARAALADGRRAYDAMSLDGAIARLGQAVSLYEQTGPLLGDLNELEVALAHLAASLILRGSADEGESAFVELLTIDPGHQLDGFPPAVQAVFDRAVVRVEKTPTGSVEVYSTPPYAAVYVDGRFEGVTPATLENLVAGKHFVRLEKNGYITHGAPLEVAPEQRITRQTRLLDIKRGAELRDLLARAAREVGADEKMGGSLRGLTRILVADLLMFVTVTQSGRDATLIGGVFDGNAGIRIATERAVIAVDAGETFDRELGAFVDRMLEAARTGKPSEGTSSGGTAKSGGSGAFGLGQNGGGNNAGGDYSVGGQAKLTAPPTPSEVYLGWTLIGVGAASVATGIGFGISALLVHNDFKETQQASPDLPEIRDTGKRNALISDILVGTGAGLAIGGVAILLISKARQPSARELLNQQASFVPLEGGGLVTWGADF